jgi:sensor c-di-GMP phosphodiesterase-like protein
MLDDFGTGYSSLSCLQLFPLDHVKIDLPAVNWTGSERANNTIASAILHMASSLGLRPVAEAGWHKAEPDDKRRRAGAVSRALPTVSFASALGSLVLLRP